MNALNLINVGRIMLGISVAGIGLTHFYFPGVQPILAPLPPETLAAPIGYVVGLALTISGIALIINVATKFISLSLAGFFVFCFVVIHLPNRITHHPGILAYWTDAIKILAMAGGVMILGYAIGWTKNPATQAELKLASIGKYSYTLMLIAFGIDHFLYIEYVHKLVPSWIPLPEIWTYATGLALISAGVAIIARIKLDLTLSLLALMLLIWLMVLHLPATLQFPMVDTGPLIGSLTCAYFAAIAILLKGLSMRTS